MDAIEKRRRELYAEMRTLNQKMRRVSQELGDLDRGVMPPQRFDENYVPPYLRKTEAIILPMRRRKTA